MIKLNNKLNEATIFIIAFILLSAAFLIFQPSYSPTGFAVKEPVLYCYCQGIRYVTLKTDYIFINGSNYNIAAEVFQGSNINPGLLIDSEIINFNSIPQNNIDYNPGTYRGNLIIEKINPNNIIIKFHNTTENRLFGDNTFRITINSVILGPDMIHLSCSEPVDIGDIFGDFEVIDIDKILSGPDCTYGAVNLLNPPNNSVDNDGNVNFEYNVYDANQSIDFCELIINGAVYQTVYSIEEGISQYFNQLLPNGTYYWSVNCTTSNGYEIESKKRIIHINIKTNKIKGIITNSGYNLVASAVKIYDNGELILEDDEVYDFNLGDGIYNIKVNPSSGNLNELYIYNLTFNTSIVNFTRLEDSPENIFRNFFPNLTEAVSWQINPLAVYDKVKVNLSYGSGTDLGLWKCTDFDFDNQTCRDNDNWTLIQNLSDGPDTIIFYLSANDPAVVVSPGDKPPITKLNYPLNNFISYTSTSYNITFNCSAEDEQGSNKGIKNISLYLTNNQNTSFSLNQTINFSGLNTEETALFNKTLAIGNYTWNCLAYDNGGNYDWGDSNRSIKIMSVINDTTPPVVTLISPANNSVDYDGYITFQYNTTDNESNIAYCELIINNSVVDTDYSITENIPQSFSKNLANGTYYWSVNCTNTFNLTASSETWIIIVNITAAPPANVTCCCGLSVSTTPEIVAQQEKVLIAADVSNLFTGLAAIPSDIISLNVTIYRIENGTETIIVNNAPMIYLAGGLWYYEFYTGNNTPGTYVASVTMLTNQTTPFVKEASDTFTVGERISGLTITGVSPDLVNINQTIRLAAEVKYNSIAVDDSLILNASLVIQKINGTNQTYTINNSLQVNDGIIYLDGSFNETGVYYLDWGAAYLGQARIAREIIVVVGWEELLEDINYTINTELVNLIKESRQYLLELLINMEYMQQFSEEEIFLITDSVNSMTKIVSYLETGEITNEEAEKQFNRLKEELEDKLGLRITGSAIGLDPGSLKKSQSPIDKIIDSLKDWRLILFILLLFMFIMLMAILLVLIRILQTAVLNRSRNQPLKQVKIKQTRTKTLGKRRYEILIGKIKNKLKQREQRKKKEIKSHIINLDRKFYKKQNKNK